MRVEKIENKNKNFLGDNYFYTQNWWKMLDFHIKYCIYRNREIWKKGCFPQFAKHKKCPAIGNILKTT